MMMIYYLRTESDKVEPIHVTKSTVLNVQNRTIFFVGAFEKLCKMTVSFY